MFNFIRQLKLSVSSKIYKDKVYKEKLNKIIFNIGINFRKIGERNQIHKIYSGAKRINYTPLQVRCVLVIAPVFKIRTHIIWHGQHIYTKWQA